MPLPAFCYQNAVQHDREKYYAAHLAESNVILNKKMVKYPKNVEENKN